MSNMNYEVASVAGDVQILKRSPFEGVAITLDFAGVAEDVVKAGTPIGANGKADNSATAKGILLHDVSKDRPQGTILKKAYINKSVAEAHAGITYDAGIATALPMIVLE